MSPSALPHDPLWPRAGDWPAAVAGERADVAAGRHPDPHPVAVADAGAPDAGGGARGAAAVFAAHRRVAHRGCRRRRRTRMRWTPPPGSPLIEAELLIAIGGDNSATVPVALGRGATRARHRRRPPRPARRHLERIARAPADRGRARRHRGRADRHRAARQLARVREARRRPRHHRRAARRAAPPPDRRRHGRGARARRQRRAPGARRPRRRRVRPLGRAGLPGVGARAASRRWSCAPPRGWRGCIPTSSRST